MYLKLYKQQLNIMLDSERHDDAIALTCCIVILIIALGLGYFREVGTFGVESDFYEAYAIQAENILAGKHYTYQHNPPGYPLILAAVTYLVKNTFLAGKIISAVGAALFGWISYLLLSDLFGRKLALISTILSLITIIPYSFVAATDTVGALAIVLPLWLVLRSPSLSMSAYFIAGILAGIAYLIRSNAVFVSVGIIIALIWLNIPRESWQNRLIKAGIFCLGILAIALPWWLYNWQINGSPLASTAYLQIAAHFYHEEDDEFITTLTEMSSRFSSFSEVLLADPARVIAIYLKDILFLNIPKLFVPKALFDTAKFPVYQIIIAIPLLLFTGGLATACRKISSESKGLIASNLKKRIISFLIVNLLGYLILGLVGFHRRYYIFLFPIVFIIIIYPLFHQRFFQKLGKVAVSRILIFNLFLPLAIAAYIESASVIAEEPKYLLEIADYLQKHSTANEIIITRKPHVAYLSGLKSTFPLANSADEYLVKAREVKANYILYSNRDRQLWEGLKSLENPQTLPKQFQLIYAHQPSNTLIYRITK